MLSRAALRSKFFILKYTYVPDMLNVRTPHRPGHLEAINSMAKRGLVFAGAFTNPVDSGEFMFEGEDDSAPREFVQRDPYMQNKLVTHHTIREILVVAGRILDKK